MYPPIFQVCAAAAPVTALLGAGPTRLYPFGEAPQGVALPYAVWQSIGGMPENNISDPPDMDVFSLQITVYANTPTAATNPAKALRDAIEPHAHITRWGGDGTDPDTKNKFYSFDVDWHVPR